MSDSHTKEAGGGLAFTVFIIFLILKLTDQIDWSWVWVCSPLWIGIALGLLLFAIAGVILLAGIIGVGLAELFDRLKNRDE